MNKRDLAAAKAAATKRIAARPVRLRGGEGPGSRQPVLKLPATMPDGKRSTLHPFVYLMRQGGQTFDHNKSDLARFLGVRPQSLYKWERKCLADRNFPLPVLRAHQLADYFKVEPRLFRPDFPWSPK